MEADLDAIELSYEELIRGEAEMSPRTARFSQGAVSGTISFASPLLGLMLVSLAISLGENNNEPTTCWQPDAMPQLTRGIQATPHIRSRQMP